MRLRIPCLVALSLTMLLNGCGAGAPKPTEASKDGQGAESNPGTPAVYVDNDATRCFVARVGGARVNAVRPDTGGEDPEFWMPGETAAAKYQQAELICITGAGYPQWTGKYTLPESKLVDTSAGFKDAYIVLEHAVSHAHGPEGEHSHAGAVGQLWLDPLQAKQQAQAIHDALAKKWPAHAAEFKQNLEVLHADLDALDAAWQGLMKAYDGAPIMLSHPVYQYLARRYKWNVRYVHFEPGEMPDAEAWRGLAGILKEHKAKFMLWEDEPLPEIAKKLKDEYGLDSAVCRQGALLEPGRDYLKLQHENIGNLRAVFGK
ncbi:MAG: metal ABC transporter substrate-binding protein [Planctomycetota bacterium]|nr:metal ABC transporter substrate-binding protein [Planctomycetota bacterium]